MGCRWDAGHDCCPIPPSQVILFDLGLPGEDGFAVLERFISNRVMSDISVIVVTARDQQEVEKKAGRLDAVDYVSQPITMLATRDRAPAGVSRKSATMEWRPSRTTVEPLIGKACHV